MPRSPGDDGVPSEAALPPGAVARGQRAPDRLAADRPRPGGAQARLVGSRLPLAYAKETGANFLTAGALDAARTRTSTIEPHQSFDHQRLWADLLSSEAVAFNLFGDLAADLALADQAVHTWWPDAPGSVCERPLCIFAGSSRSRVPQQSPGVRRRVRARSRRRDAGDRRRRHQVPRARQAGDPEAEQPLALSRGRRSFSRLRRAGDRRGQGEDAISP